LSLIAPDLRGRGDSASLPGPFGMEQHARDLAAVLDDAGARHAVAVGHSMGGFVMATFAALFPERTRGLVLVDGGPTPGGRLPDDVDIDAVLAQVIGPAVGRLDQRFASAEQYRRFWLDYPALRDSDIDADTVTAYADHDLHGPDGDLRSKVSAAAVRADARDTLVNEQVRTTLAAIGAPTVLLLAERGMLNGPTPLYPDDAVDGLTTAAGPLEVVRVADTNHYSVCMGRVGARAIARHLRRFAGKEG
jgi:pimeloyl-ACP methyl ester carboxylesterase